MAYLLPLDTVPSEKGDLTVYENHLPDGIKRMFFIDNVASEFERGGHRHKKTHQLLVCLKGSVKIYNHNGNNGEIFILNKKNQALYLFPEDWHTMYQFTPDAILLVLANTLYDVDDYIDSPYPVACSIFNARFSLVE